MFIVVNQYDTQEVYVNEDLTGKAQSRIVNYILNLVKENYYYVGDDVSVIPQQFNDWLERVKTTNSDYRDRHFRVDMYTDTSLDSYSESVIVYYKDGK